MGKLKKPSKTAAMLAQSQFYIQENIRFFWAVSLVVCLGMLYIYRNVEIKEKYTPKDHKESSH